MNLGVRILCLAVLLAAGSGYGLAAPVTGSALPELGSMPLASSASLWRPPLQACGGAFVTLEAGAFYACLKTPYDLYYAGSRAKGAG